MSDLSHKKCIPCEVGGEPMSSEQIQIYLKNVPSWKLSSDGKKISRPFKFKDFSDALIFVNKVGELAESEGHHPDFSIHYNQVTLELWTHEVGGLTENDFIVATKIDILK